MDQTSQVRGRTPTRERGGEQELEIGYKGLSELAALPRDVASLTVTACGRTIIIPQCPRTVQDIQRILQQELCMQDQIFQISDGNGKKLLLDVDLHEAVRDGRTPLTAALSDASVHFIENRREELAQMQWRLVRDQHHDATSKMSQAFRQISSFERKLEQFASDVAWTVEQLQKEIATKAGKDDFNNRFMEVNERISGTTQMLNTERNLREVAVEQVNKSLQGFRDVIDDERERSKQTQAKMMAAADGARKLVESDRGARDALEERQAAAQHSLNVRMDELTAVFKEALGQYGKQFETSSANTVDAMEKLDRKSSQVRADSEAAANFAASRLRLLEERFASLESRYVEGEERHLAAIDWVAQRHDKVTGNMEQLRFNDGQQVQTLQAVMSRVDELAAAVKASDTAVHEVQARERSTRDEELQALRAFFAADQDRLRAHLDGRVQQCFEHEAAVREETLSQILDTVSRFCSQPAQPISRQTGSRTGSGAPTPGTPCEGFGMVGAGSRSDTPTRSGSTAPPLLAPPPLMSAASAVSTTPTLQPSLSRPRLSSGSTVATEDPLQTRVRLSSASNSSPAFNEVRVVPPQEVNGVTRCGGDQSVPFPRFSSPPPPVLGSATPGLRRSLGSYSVPGGVSTTVTTVKVTPPISPAPSSSPMQSPLRVVRRMR